MTPGRAGAASSAFAALGLVAYAWWATGLRPFTAPALVATVGAGAVAMVTASRLRPSGPEPAPSPPPRLGSRIVGLAVWAFLILAVAAWEVAAYVQHPRADHPTLSYVADSALDHRVPRAIAFSVWLGLSAELARRSPARDPQVTAQVARR